MMKSSRIPIALAANVILWSVTFVLRAAPVDPDSPTAFTYQGQLTDGNIPIDGVVDFQVSLWDADVNGNMRGSCDVNGVIVSNGGVSTILLDYGTDAFVGGPRWLQFAVQADGGGFAVLAPRQRIRPVPVAMIPQFFGVPTGTVTMFAGAIANIPASWLLCDGSVVQRAQFPRLFSVIGLDYSKPGDVDDGTTFRLPDLRNRFPLGADQDVDGIATSTITGTAEKLGGDDQNKPPRTSDIRYTGPNERPQGNDGREFHVHEFTPPFVAMVFILLTVRVFSHG